MKQGNRPPADGNNPMKPKLIVIAGPNGSGKTSVTMKLIQHEWMDGCVCINPDIIARDEYGDWNSPDAVMKAVKRAADLREEYVRNKQSFLFETVFSAPDKLDFLRRAKAVGFFTRLFFVGTDNPIINVNRIAHRIAEGGHAVPIDKIYSRFGKSIANCCV